jgi:hypothetical protein
MSSRATASRSALVVSRFSSSARMKTLRFNFNAT